jgi:DNA-binding GntR family transcriptional regulator
LVVNPFDERTGGLGETIAGEGAERMKGFGRSLPQQIARILREEIIERKLPPGSKLPEPALVDRFETSRAPIREALYLLAQEGLIERTPRKGALVKGYARQEISELYRVRITLEKMALERICEKPETIRACLAALEPIAREMEKAKGGAARYHDLNFSFHKTIIILSQSDLLRRLYAQIEGPLKVVLRK